MDDIIEKFEIVTIDKFIKYLSYNSFMKILLDKVKDSFILSFNNTNEEYNFKVETKIDPLALENLRTREFILSQKTIENLRGNLRYELLSGLEANESIDQIKRRLDTIFVTNAVNTERIARTEVLHSLNAGRTEAYKSSDVVQYKMWQAAVNNTRTAADSKRLHGQIQKLSDSFVDPETGDTFMHPPNRPNCRCTTVPLIDLPDKIITVSGQMYDADEKLGKIEFSSDFFKSIDLLKSQDKTESLNKNEREVWVKQTAKRKGHWRKIKGVKPDVKRVEIDTKSIKTDGLSRIKAIIPNVNFDGATEKQLNSIAEAVEGTIGKFPDAKVDSMGWATRIDDATFGLPDAAYIPKQHGRPKSKIILRKSVADDTESWADKAKLNFATGKQKGIKSCNNMIKFYTDCDLPEDVDIFKEKLEGINACSCTFVALTGEDRLKGIMIHECYHAIAGEMGLEDTFAIQLEKNGVTKRDKMAVSDYGSSQDVELWAETGLAMELGIDIPDPIKQAFESTMETIR